MPNTITECGAKVGRRYAAADIVGRYGMAGSAAQDAKLKAQAWDYFSNPAARTGWATPSLTEATEYELVRLSYDYWLMITLYRNHWISGMIVDVPAEDMTRAWPRLTSDIEPDDITKINRTIRETNTKISIQESMKWARLFGGAGALIVIEGQENVLDEPLDLDTVELGGYKGLIPFDRWSGIYPVSPISTNLSNPRLFNLPEFYEVYSAYGGGQFRVHASRILRFTGPTVPQPEYQAQSYWGISSLERAYEEIRKRDNMSWNILGLTYRAQLIGMQYPDLAQALSGAGNSQAALQRLQQSMQAMNQLMSNQSLLLLPKDGQMSSVNYGFSGLGDVYQQFQLDIAGAARIPVTRLFGRTLSGLGQSNDQDERVYEEYIQLEQETRLRPQLDVLYPVICMSTLGEVPDDLDLLFPSVRVMDQKEKAELAKSVSDSIVAYFNAGIYDKAMALREIKQSADITELGTNVTDEIIQKAEDEQAELEKMGLAGLQGETAQSGEEIGKPQAKKPGPQLVTAKAGARARDVLASRRKRLSNIPTDLPTESATTPAEEVTGLTPITLDEPVALESSLELPAKDENGGDPNLRVRLFAGIPVTIEFKAGDRRMIRNEAGMVVYDRIMEHDYGFLNGTIGRDGDEIDCILGPTETSDKIYIVDFVDLGPDVAARTDEDKIMIGFYRQDAALKGFLALYPPEFMGGITEISRDDFMADWLGKSRALDQAV